MIRDWDELAEKYDDELPQIYCSNEYGHNIAKTILSEQFIINQPKLNPKTRLEEGGTMECMNELFNTQRKIYFVGNKVEIIDQ